MNMNQRNAIRTNNITIIGSNTPAGSIIKVVPVLPANEFTKVYKNEYNVVLKKSSELQHDILQFMEDTTSNYSFSEKDIFLQQLCSSKNKGTAKEEDAGAGGSTFRRNTRKYSSRETADEATNYKLTIKSGLKSQKVFRTVPQQVNTNSRYFVFMRTISGTFEAHPIANWYKMIPHSTMDATMIEESDREFTKGRQAVEDQLSKMRREVESDGYSERENKVKMMVGEGEVLSEEEGKESEVLNRRKKVQLFQKLRYGKKEFVDEESDKDDHEGDEVDYMSDSSCDEEKLSEDERDKIYECVNVDEEEMLTKELELSDESGNEEDSKKEEKVEAAVTEDIAESSSESDSDSDSDDDDDKDDSDDNNNNNNESIIKQKSLTKLDNNNNNNNNNNSILPSLKRPLLNNSPTVGSLIKKAKLSNNYNNDNGKQKEIIEEIRKHLLRKPMSGKELFRMLIKKQLLVNDEVSKKKLLDGFVSLSAKHDMVNGERMYRL